MPTALCSEPAVAALIVRGDHYKQRGALAEARECYKLAVQAAPGDPKAHRSLGEILAAQKHYVEGMAEINTALKINSDDHKLYVDRALCYVGLGNNAAAEADFKKAITKPTCGSACYGYLEDIYKRQGKFDEAIALCSLQLKREPTYYQSYEHMARYQMLKKDWPAARASLDKAIAKVPYNYLHYQLRGDADMGAGLAQDAVVDYSKALDLEPFFTAEIYLARARAYAKLGKKELEKKDLASAQIKD